MEAGFLVRARPYPTYSPPKSPLLDVRKTQRTDIDTDRSAERIAGYLNAYSPRTTLRSQTSRDQPMTRKSSYNPFRRVESPRTVTTECSPDDRKTFKVAAVTREAMTVEHTVNVYRSDRMELERDLSTYESCRRNRLRIAERLVTVSGLIETLPDAVDPILEIERHADLLYGNIQRSFAELSASTPQSAARSITRPLRLSIRPLASSHRLYSCYRGVYSISSIPTLVHIRANETLTVVHIAVLTTTGLRFNVRLQQRTVSKMSANKYIQTEVLPRLFFQPGKAGGLQLNSDSGNGKRFATVIATLQGHRGAVCVTIRESNGDVVVSSPAADAAISLSTSAIFGSSGIFSISARELRRIIEKGLLVARGKLIWCATGARGVFFSEKEKDSKLFDPDYLSEMMSDFLNLLIFREEVVVDGSVYTVELFAYKSIEKLKISHQISHQEISFDSHFHPLLHQLQFSIIQKSSQTFLRSLELALIIRSLFRTRKNSQISD